MTSVREKVSFEGLISRPRERLHLIHWGSSVTVSPGVTIDLVESLGRLVGGAMSMSPSESAESESEASL